MTKMNKGIWQCFCVFLFSAKVFAESAPENLAYSAHITANSEYSADYRAENVANGRIPAMGSQGDAGQAWCVNGAESAASGTLTFVWETEQRIGEVIFYARNAWLAEDSWRHCALYIGNMSEPFHRAVIEQRDGPQRITLPKPVQTRKLRLYFTESYGGPNPGASEVQIFSESPSDAVLHDLRRHAGLRHMPWVDRVDAARLEALIRRLRAEHGAGYAQYDEHLDRLARLREGDASRATAGALARLQREALLFDVDSLLLIKRHEINPSHVYTYHYEGFIPGGGLYTASIREDSPVFTELVASPTGQILDCDLSYDGRTVLFSWRRTQDEGYHLWTVGVDGVGLRQITDGPWHDYNACWLPDGGIAFLSTRTAQFAYCWNAPVGVVYRMDADGGNVKRLSANYLNDFTPYVLDDGRIIFSRWEYVDRPAIPIQSLWTIHPDGTALAGYFGNRVLSPGTFMEARSIPGTGKIVCTMTGHNGPARGALGIIDRRHGDNHQASIENITPDVPVPGVHEGNGNTEGTKQYSSPIPLDAVRLLASIQGPVLARDFDGHCQSLALPPPDDGMQFFAAQPIRPRPRPPVLPSAAVSEADGDYATVVLQDVYAGLAPAVARGSVTHLRIVREMPKTVRIEPHLRAFGFQFPVVSCGATYAPKDVLGEVPINPDGSAVFRVPAGIPVYFMVLDAEGRAVQRMRTFTHFMPGERQGCVGCHEPRGQTPVPGRALATLQHPRDIEAPEWGAGGFSYPDVVQPALDQHCVACHHPLRAEGGIDLTGSRTDYFSVSYEMLAREPQGPEGSPYVSWIPTYNGHEQNILAIAPLTWGSPASTLANLVLNGHPDADGAPRVALDPSSRRRILAWIDLNVPYYHTSETSHPENEGCRRIYSEEVDRVLHEVAQRRCMGCHVDTIPRTEWTRVTEVAWNTFLLAPLARAAGGTERCGAAVFADTSDPDYQAILGTLTPLEESLRSHPRTDMPGAQPAPHVCRDRY